MSTLVQSVDAFTHQGYKTPRELNHYNEDRLVVGRNLFAVIDGATAVVNVDMGGLNPSAYISNYLADYLMAVSADDPRTALELLTDANDAVREHFRTEWPEVFALGKLGPSCAAAIVRLHPETNTMTVASVADCSVVMRRKGKGWNVITPTRKGDGGQGRLSKRLHDVLAKQIAKGMTPEQAKQSEPVQEILKNNRMRVNVEFGSFNGEKDAEKFFFSQTLSLAELQHLAMFSDGLEDPDGETHADQCVGAAQEMYARGVRNYHAFLKNDIFGLDEDFTRYPRAKHMDDSTGIVLTFRP